MLEEQTDMGARIGPRDLAKSLPFQRRRKWLLGLVTLLAARVHFAPAFEFNELVLVTTCSLFLPPQLSRVRQIG